MKAVDIDRLHTTELGVVRIAGNIGIPVAEALNWCKSRISDPCTKKYRKGKNWYYETEDAVITVNASSLTIITAHRRK